MITTDDRFQLDPNSYGGSLQGHFSASYADLEKLLGPPSESDGYKVSTEWVLVDTMTGETVTVYDYKETDLYSRGNISVDEFRKLPSYNWHIGGESHAVANEFIRFLSQKLRENHSG